MEAEPSVERATTSSKETNDREDARPTKQTERRRLRGTSRTGFILLAIIVASIAFLLAVPVTLETMGTATQRTSAKAAFTDYLTALSTGDGARAAQYVEQSATNQSAWDSANEMLANASERIHIVNVNEPNVESPDDTMVEVSATVSLAGVNYDIAHYVERRNERWYVVPTGPQLSGNVTVSSDVGDYLTIGGVRTELTEAEGTSSTAWAPAHRIFAHMGVYPIERPSSPWLDAASEARTITLIPGIEGGSQAHLVGKPTATFTERMQAAVEDAEHECQDWLAHDLNSPCALWSFNDAFKVADSVTMLEQPSLTITSLRSVQLSGGTAEIKRHDGVSVTVTMLEEPIDGMIVFENGEPSLGYLSKATPAQ